MAHMAFEPTSKAHFVFCKKWLEDMETTCGDLGILSRLDTSFDMTGPPELLSMGVVTWLYSRHKKLGHPVIEPDPQLAAALADHTDFNDMVDVVLPEMPHSHVWITFPPGFDIYLEEVLSEERLRVAGAYVASVKQNNRDKEAFIIYLWAPPKRGREMGDDRFSYLCIWPGIDIGSKLSEKWSDGEVVDGQITSMLKTFSQQEKEDWLRALRMILGILLYMQCDGAIIEAVTPQDREESFRRRHGRKKNFNKGRAGRERKVLDQYGHSTIVYVGSGWGSTKDGKAYAAGRASENPESRRRHWVRGHFRNQAHGEGRRLRKRIFISPHQRGDEDKPEGDVTYKVRV